jgi:hypothetical protein
MAELAILSVALAAFCWRQWLRAASDNAALTEDLRACVRSRDAAERERDEARAEADLLARMLENSLATERTLRDRFRRWPVLKNVEGGSS